MKSIINAILSSLLVLSVYFGVLTYTDIPDRIILNGHITYIEGETYDDVWEAYDELPPKVKDMILDGYTIYIVDVIGNDENIGGRVTYAPKILEVKYNTYDAKYVMFHECGHILDNELADFGLISSSDEFKEIYEKEKHTVIFEYNYDYATSTPAEYFASCFAEYMTNPERLKQTAPETYYFIENRLK